MAWRYHGHARVNPDAPEAFGVCDRCGRLFNLNDLYYQYEWAGTALVNRHIRVCRQDLDKPFQFYRAIILPADPVPVYDPRPENFVAEDEGGTPTPPVPNPTFTLDQSELDQGDPLG